MKKVLFCYLLFCHASLFGQGSVETIFGRMIEVVVWDGEISVEDFVVQHCCTGWKWGSNRILVLGITDEATYAVTSSQVMDGSDEEAEINLTRIDLKGKAEIISLFKREDNMKFDSLQWKAMVTGSLKELSVIYPLQDLKMTEVFINEKKYEWIARVNSKERNQTITWSFLTDTQRGHEFYFEWKIESEPYRNTKDFRIFDFFLEVPLDALRESTGDEVRVFSGKDSVLFKRISNQPVSFPSEWFPDQLYYDNRDSVINEIQKQIKRELPGQKKKYPLLKTHQVFAVPAGDFAIALVFKPYNEGTIQGVMATGNDQMIFAELYLNSSATRLDWLKRFSEISFE